MNPLGSIRQNATLPLHRRLLFLCLREQSSRHRLLDGDEGQLIRLCGPLRGCLYRKYGSGTHHPLAIIHTRDFHLIDFVEVYLHDWASNKYLSK